MAKTNNPPKSHTPRPAPAFVPMQPVPSETPATIATPQPHRAPTIATDSGVSPLMQGSLPPMASGSDVYARQFYGGAPLPKRRFLPVGLVP